MTPTTTEHVPIAIIGTGFSGLGMAIRLKQAGRQDFVLLERADDVGGTWRDNSYPGCQCDVPSHLYSFSFAPNPDWSRAFSGQAEIWAYLQRCSRDFGIEPHVRYGHEVRSGVWDEGANRWVIETAKGSLTADVVISGTGPLSDPQVPDLPGLDTFEGTTFHSAQWNHEHDLTGERVAVIGTGASAIQFVPRIQPKVGHLDLYQRTAPWVLPHPGRPVTKLERRLFRAFPPLQKLWRAGIYATREALVLGLRYNRRFLTIPQKIAERHIAARISDPELRRKVTPDYTIGCKRILISNEYYPALDQPNVDVVTEGIREVRPHSIVAADGTEREVDTIIFGTGFHVTDMPIADHIRGRGGRTLREAWSGGMQAFRGSTVAGFPNLFFLVGPNTGLGHNSIVYMIESQIRYILGALDAMQSRGARTVEVRPEAQHAYNEAIQRELRPTVWNQGGCASWYLDEHGRNTTLWPTFTFTFRRSTREFDPAAYVLRGAAEALEQEDLGEGRPLELA